MDDIGSLLPPNGDFAQQQPSRRPPRLRTTSASSYASTANGAPTSTLRKKHSTLSARSNDSDVSEIYAPVPRRHHIHNSEIQRWLATPSPSSSRAVSPSTPTAASATGSFGRRSYKRSRHLSFSSLMEKEGGVSPAFRTSSRLSGIGEATNEIRGSSESTTGGGMGRRWVRWMHDQGIKAWVVPTAVLIATWVKWAVGLGTYSGNATPPMYGDYEAQRHWMELTIHLPFRQWYTYDLQYWGLDYPPLTAYISWICGYVGTRINPSWFALDASRGVETSTSKVYMRTTVLLFDLLIYIPALVLFVRTWLANRSARTQNIALISLLFQPTLLLIDFGHFQYNSVMLGFTLLALVSFAKDLDELGAAFFVLSLGFKQMSLYYAPAIGTYLLGKCLYLGPAHGITHLFRIALATLITFTLLFAPWLPPFSPAVGIIDPITRIFPLARGLFEDKVANFWCASDVVLKWRQRLGATTLIRLSMLFTAVGFLPAAAGLLRASWVLRHDRPSAPAIGAANSGSSADGHAVAPAVEGVGRKNRPHGPSPALALLPNALLTSSLSFFLFSFQVHEKTALLPLLPLNLLLAGASAGSAQREWGVLVNNVAMFSMWPLLKRDGQGLAYVMLSLLWNRLIGADALPSFSHRPTTVPQLLSLVVYPSILILHLVEALFTPPIRYPDLFPVLNVLLCAPIFGLAWCWSIVRGVETLWALGALGSDVSTPSSTRGTAPSKGKERANGEAKSPEVRIMSSNPASPTSPASPVVEL